MSQGLSKTNEIATQAQLKSFVAAHAQKNETIGKCEQSTHNDRETNILFTQFTFHITFQLLPNFG